MTTTIHLSVTEQKAIASMIHATAPKDNVAALSMVKLIANLDGSITLHATNRMVIAEQTFMPYSPVSLTNDEPLEILISPDILKAMKTAKYDGSITVGDLALTYTNYSGLTLTQELPKGKFPDISPYLGSSIEIEMIRPATDFVRVNLDLLTGISKLVSPLDYKTDIPAYDIYTQERSDNGKPKPILFKRANILAVVQPMLVK